MHIHTHNGSYKKFLINKIIMKVCKDGHLGGQIHSQTFKKVKYFIAFHINLILIRLVLVYGGNMGRDILIPCAGN